MRYLRFQLLAVLLCLISNGIAAANVLRVDSVKYPAGKTVSLPILMENQSDIVKGYQMVYSIIKNKGELPIAPEPPAEPLPPINE